jgi:outer membrane protein assembly factor BamB
LERWPFLRDIDQTGHEDLLRKLAHNSDEEIRRSGLTVLNAHLIKSPSTQPSAGGSFCRVDESGIRSVSFAGDLLIVASDSRVRAIETETRREAWSRPIGSGIGELTLSDDQQVILGSESGALMAFDRQGRMRWSRPAGQNSTDEVKRLLRFADELLVLREHTLERLDSDTGATRATVQATDAIVGADSNGRSACWMDGAGLHCLPSGSRNFSNGGSVSIFNDSVCTTTGAASDQVMTCLSFGALAELWRWPFHSNAYHARVAQDGPRVYVYTSGGLTAIRSTDGATLWGTGEPWVSQELLATRYGLLGEDDTGSLQLRDPQTGEIRRVWPQVRATLTPAVHGKWTAVFDHGVLWLLNLSGAETPL